MEFSFRNRLSLYGFFISIVCGWVIIAFADVVVKLRDSHPPSDVPLARTRLAPTPTPEIFSSTGNRKALNVGFPKSGSTSLFEFFKCGGLRVQHFCCCGDTSDHPPCKSKTMAECILNNIARGDDMLQECGDYDVYAQIDGERPTRILGNHLKGVLMENGTMQELDQRTFEGRTSSFMHFLPQHFHLDELHRSYPDSVFILPLREPDQWANSVYNWFQMRARVVNEYRHFNASIRRPGKNKAKEFLARVYREHIVYVKSFVQRHPSHELVQFNISDPNAGQILSAVYGSKATCWGHHNKAGRRAKQPEIVLQS